MKVAHSRYKKAEWRDDITENLPNVILVSKNDVSVYMGHGNIHREFR